MPTTRDYWWGLPALLVGVLAMVAGDVGTGRALANGVFFLLGLGAVVWVGRAAWTPGPVAGCVLCGLLLASLLGPGLDGVHRWIDIGPLSLNVSMLVAPLVLAVMAHLIAHERVRWAVALAATVQLIHLAQPDAAQGAAFATGAIVLLLMSFERPSALTLTGAAALLACALATFARRDPLAPVAEVEGIVGLARDASALLGALALIACFLQTVPFVRSALLSRRSATRIVRAAPTAVCAYVVVQLLAPIVLHAPVPVMGYGPSTVLAYAAAFIATRAMPRDATPAKRSGVARGSWTAEQRPLGTAPTRTRRTRTTSPRSGY
ncbi:hypothetical protein OJ998_00430 [Solirubrobacter taibaiensis]|nr:hypothetical protein [Solirubrobacter taibaiensis]